jgi:hypothetical protein
MTRRPPRWTRLLLADTFVTSLAAGGAIVAAAQTAITPSVLAAAQAAFMATALTLSLRCRHTEREWRRAAADFRAAARALRPHTPYLDRDHHTVYVKGRSYGWTSVYAVDEDQLADIDEALTAGGQLPPLTGVTYDTPPLAAWIVVSGAFGSAVEPDGDGLRPVEEARLPRRRRIRGAWLGLNSGASTPTAEELTALRDGLCRAEEIGPPDAEQEAPVT